MLRDEIRRCMQGLSSDGNGHLSARFVFPDTFIGFQGHFPGNPVLPGLCTIQAVLVMLESSRKRQPLLQHMINIKFLSMVRPDSVLQFESSVSNDDSGCNVVKTAVSCNGSRIAQISLQVRFDGASVEGAGHGNPKN